MRSTHHTRSRGARRGLAAPAVALLAAGGLVLATAPAASAHVTVSATTTDAGAYTVLTFSVPHGCEDSPTTTVAIQVPEEILSVTPTVNPRWEVEKVMETLDEPVEGAHGQTFTERVAEVVYTTDDPLPADLRDTMELSLQLPDRPGETLAFPVVQTCVAGESAWAQLALEGEEEPEKPAPVLTLTDPEGQADDGVEDAAEVDLAAGDDTAAAVAAAATTDSGTGTGLLVAAVALGAAGAAMGGVALTRTRTRT